MNKKPAIISVIFVVIAGVIIWGGAWYSAKMQSDQSAAAAAQNAAQAEQTQEQIMQNLKITDTVVGTGTVAAAGDTVTVNYTGTFDDGTKFDSSYDHGQPFSFVLGERNVIAGWDYGVLGMKVGGTRTLVVPPELGYGSSQYGPIPPNSTLHFTIQLLAVSTSTPTSTGQ